MNATPAAYITQCLGWTLVHFVWQGLAVAAWLALCLRVLRKNPPGQQYLAGCVALMAVAVLPLLTFNQLVRQYHPVEPQTGLVSVVGAKGIAPASVTTIGETTPVTVTMSPGPSHQPTYNERLELALPWLVILWVGGVLALSVRLLLGWMRVWQLAASSATTLEGAWSCRMAELAERMRISRPVKLVQSALVEVPAMIGWLRPVILLPASCLIGLTPAQLDAVLAHELAHIRRHDYLVNLLQSSVETLLFYHPAVWWISGQIREAREHCCDDLAVSVCGDRVNYARALATLEELRQPASQLLLAAGGAPLLDRIRRIAARREAETNRLGSLLSVLLTLTIVAALLAGFRENQARADEGGRGVGPEGSSQSPMQLAQNLTPSQAFARTNRAFVNTSRGRKAILAKLENIRLDYLSCDHVALGDLLEQLGPILKARDPEKKGVNFILDQTALAREAQVDPATGLPVTVASGKSLDAGSALITIKPELKDLRLVDVLDAITKGSDLPIKYAIEDYAVSFSWRSELPPMSMRRFQVDPNTFRQGLEGVTSTLFGNIQSGSGVGGGGANNGVQVPQVNVTPGTAGGIGAGGSQGASGAGVGGGGIGNVTRPTGATNVQTMVRQFFANAGVDFGTNDPANAAKAIYYNDTRGILFVRSTPADLDKIEKAVAVLNTPASPPPAGDATTNPVEVKTAPTAAPDKITNAPPAKPKLDDLDLATSEALHRQAYAIELRQYLLQAQSAQQKKDYVTASKLYETCFGLVQKIGGSATNERQKVITGLCAVQLELARQAQKNHDYKRAEEILLRSLTLDPKNEAALAARRENYRLQDLQAINAAGQDDPARMAAANTNQIHAATLVQNAKYLFEAGKLDAAQMELELALKEDPDNLAAVHYLELINDKRMAIATRRSELASRAGQGVVEEIWALPNRRSATDQAQPPRATEPLKDSVPIKAVTGTNFAATIDTEESILAGSNSLLVMKPDEAHQPGLNTNQIHAATLVQNAKHLYEDGKLEAAQMEFEAALREDPDNPAAYHYLELVKDKRTAIATGQSEGASRAAIAQVVSVQDNEWPKRPAFTIAQPTSASDTPKEFSLNLQTGNSIPQNYEQWNRAGNKTGHTYVFSTKHLDDRNTISKTEFKRPLVNLRMKVVELDEARLPAGKLESILADLGTQVVSEAPPGIPLIPPDASLDVLENVKPALTNAVRRQFEAELNDAQVSGLTQALDGLGGADWHTTSETLAEDNQLARFQSGGPLQIVTGVTVTNRVEAKSSAAIYQVENMFFGLNVETWLHISQANSSVELKVMPTEIDFQGYADPGPPAKPAPGQPAVVQPLPQFLVGQLNARTSVQDGHTLLLGGLVKESVVKLKDKVPVLGDMPLLGHLFRSESTSKTRKLMLIFLTPTITNRERGNSDPTNPGNGKRSSASPQPEAGR